MKAPAFSSRNLTSKILQRLPDPDNSLLHLHWIYPSGLMLPALSNAGYKTVLHIHGSDWYKTIDKPGFEPLIENSLQKADTICVSGPRLKTSILKRFPGLCIHEIGNYIDTKLFSIPDSETISKARKQLRFDPNKIHFLTTANIRHEKGVDLLLDAIRMLDRNDLCFHIIGQPPGGQFAEKIESKLKKLHPGQAVIHKPVPRKELVIWYHAAVAYLLPSRSEGFNVSLLEALSSGLPAIATKVGGAEEVLAERRGLLVEPKHADSIRKAVEELLKRKEIARSKNARQFIEKNYSMEQYRKVLEDIYSGIAN